MNRLEDDHAVYVEAPQNAEAKRCRVQRGDVLLTITGSRIGRVAAVTNDPGESYISQHVAILRLSEGLLPEYLSAFLALERGGQMQIARSQYGQTKPGLNLEQIRQFAVPVPELSAQRRYVSAQRSVRAVQLKLEYFQKDHGIMTQSITARAFAGKL
jgi:type I restriction enzyme S subunit